MSVPAKYHRMTLLVDTRVVSRVKALFKAEASKYETEDAIIQLIYDTHFKIDSAASELTLTLKEGRQ